MELYEWLESNKCDLQRLAQKQRLRMPDTLEGAEAVFSLVKAGEVIKPISVGWRVRAAALAIQSGREIPDLKAYKESKSKEQKSLEAERKRLAEEWAKIRAEEKKPVPLWKKIITLWWIR